MAAENITCMDVSLYKAAARGEIEEFNSYQGIELESLQTPNHNNVLHVNLATQPLNEWYLKVNRAYGLPFSQSVSGEQQTIPKRQQKRCIDFIEQMLTKCPSLLLQTNAEGRTPLHIAARHGHSEIVKFLIEFQTKVVQENLEQQETALEVVRRMVRMTDRESNTALHVAAKYGHSGVVQKLLEVEDPEFPHYSYGGPKGRTVLHAGAMGGSAEATRRILTKIKGNLIKERDENGHTPLHYAAHLGHYSVVEELLKWDKTVAYIADKNSEMTPLLMAARQGYHEIVGLILLFCPDCCEKVDKRGWNCLHFLAYRSEYTYDFFKYDGKTEYELVKNLKDAKDKHGITPRQVYDACQSSPVPELYIKNNQGGEKKEYIVDLLKDIVNEEVAEEAVRPFSLRTDDSRSRFDKAINAHLVVATLIATVTFAAAITLPGGYKSEKGSDQGSPFLIHDAAFIIFVISNTVAFLTSMIAIILHFQMFDSETSIHTYRAASSFIVYALNALVIAFSTATFAVLKPSLGLAIPLLCVGLYMFLFSMCSTGRGILEADSDCEHREKAQPMAEGIFAIM